MPNEFTNYEYIEAAGLDEFDPGDTTNHHLISFFQTEGFHAYYFDVKKFSKAQVQKLALEQLTVIGANSGRPLFLFGAAGKYIISPASTLLTADFTIAFDPAAWAYGPEAPFDIDFFGADDDDHDITPTRYLNRTLSALGLYTIGVELYQQLVAVIAPVEAQYQMEVAARLADRQAPRFQLNQYYNHGRQSYALTFSTLERATAALHQNPQVEYAIITNLETKSIAYSDRGQ